MNTLSKSLLLPVGVIAGSLLTAAVVVGQAAPLTTLTSPNGQFIIDVQDDGITMTGPGINVELNNAGVLVDTDLAVTVNSGQNTAITSDAAFNVSSQQDTAIASNAAFRVSSQQDTAITSNAAFNVDSVQALSLDSAATVVVTSVQDTSFDSQAQIRVDSDQDTTITSGTAIRLAAPVIQENGVDQVVDEEVVE